MTVSDLRKSKCHLTIIVIGASGDLAKKKTYPSLYNLIREKLLPSDTIIWGYGRTDLTNDTFHRRLLPHLQGGDSHKANDFLSRCHYQRGDSYTDLKAFEQLRMSLSQSIGKCNTIFYLAIPPDLFHKAASTIDTIFLKSSSTTIATSLHDTKRRPTLLPYWNRVILEKPFGRDLKTYQTLSNSISRIFRENEIFRIDHYLGKEMVRSIPYFRFTNKSTNFIWSRKYIRHVFIVMKEDFGTDGRGGYFDNYGILRDVMQNHLLQLLTLIAMEGEGLGNSKFHQNIPQKKIEMSVRDAKVEVLNKIHPPSYPDDCVLGQYEGYANDPTIKNKNSATPTYASVKLRIDNDRWRGVPFILVAGKALDESKVEIRIALHGGTESCSGDLRNSGIKRNELVMRIQPNPCVYLATNIISEGYNATIPENDMIMGFASNQNDDPYGKLLLDAFRGQASSFVRDDELRKSWEIFTPILKQIENVRPFSYERGSPGPHEATSLIPEVACKNIPIKCVSKTFSKL